MDQTEFINQVHAFKEELLNEVISFYDHGNKERGRIAFGRWKQRFRQFLKGLVPDEVEHFTQRTTHLAYVVKPNEHPLDEFMREDGETCIAFLDDLADSAQKGRLEFQNAETAEAESDSDFEDFGILLRKRVFDRDIARYVGDAKNNNECLTLLFVDLDSFKNVNDTHGHEAGNDVLRELFTKIQKRTRGKGVAYRVGGDEIVVLLPNYELDEALAIAELIRTDYERSDSGQKYGVTASIGVAIFPNHASNEKDLLECADAAMYLAKQRGRNAVVVSQSSSQATQAGMHTN